MARHQCPRCGKSEDLWRGVSVEGWESIGPDLEPDGQEHDVHFYGWDEAEPTGEYGCACGWEGFRGGLIVLGTDGEPLGYIHPGQTSILEPEKEET